jgi:NitT/TauT family transport system permease protein
MNRGASDIAVPRPRNRSGSAMRTTMVSLVLFLALIVIWEFVVRRFQIPEVLFPTPSAVAIALWDGFVVNPFDRVAFYEPTLQTLAEALGGLAIGFVFGIGLAVLMVRLRPVEQYGMPYIMAFQSLPKIAFAPLLIVWFGFGSTSTLVLVATSSFFPILVNVLEGFKSTDPDRIDLLRVMGASPGQVFREVVIPSALPFMFSGLQIGLVISILSAIVGEFVNGRAGLGSRIMLANNVLDIAGVFAILIVLGAIGAGLDYLLRVVRRRFLFWSPGERRVGI